MNRKRLMFCLVVITISLPALAANWQDLTDISGKISIVKDCSVAVNSLDVVNVIWCACPEVHYQCPSVYSQQLINGTWSEKVDIALSDNSFCHYCSITTGPDDRFHAAWLNGSHIDYCSTDTDGNWNEAVHLDAWADGDVSIACGIDGQIYIASTRSGGVDCVVLMRFDGTQWLPELDIKEDSEEESSACVAADRYGGAHLIWKDVERLKIRYAFIRQDGSFEIKSYPNLSNLDPSVCIDPLNILHMTYEDKSQDSKILIHYSRMYYAYGPFEDTIRPGDIVPETLTMELFSNLVIDPFLTAHASWQGFYNYGSTSPTAVFFRTISGRYPQDYDKIDMGMTSAYPIVADSHGNLHMCISRKFDDGDFQLYYLYKPRDRPGVTLWLRPQVYSSGDPFHLTANLINPSPVNYQADLYVCLAAEGAIFWYPDWTETVQSTPVDLAAGDDRVLDILDFTFPDNLPPFGPYQFYAGMVDSVSGALVGDYSGVGFLLR